MDVKRSMGLAMAAGCSVAVVLGGGTASAAASAPGTPDAERISAGPYAGFQVCGQPLLVRSVSPTLAASPTPPPGSNASPFAKFPGLTGQFEVTTADGRLLIQQATPIENGRLFVFQVPQRRLPDGQYRWRVRALNGSSASAFTPYCTFTLRA